MPLSTRFAANSYAPSAHPSQLSSLALQQRLAACCGPEPQPAGDQVSLSSTATGCANGTARLRDESERQALGEELWKRYQDGRIDLLAIQVSGRNDGADARSNIADTALGRQAKLSSYGNAPGGRVCLSFALLEGLTSLSDDHSYRVTSLAGGSHSSRSRHYLGVSFDIDQLDGQPISKNHPGFRDFMAKARALGATEVLGPGASGHDGHIHVAWPRDAVKQEPAAPASGLLA